MVVRGASMILIGLAVGLGFGSALAQKATAVRQPAPTAAPVGPDPSTTSASYGDWVLQCQRVGEPDKAVRLCEVAQTVKLRDAQQPIAEIAIGQPPSDHALHLTVVLPPNVSFPGTVRFSTSDKPEDGVELQWRRCLPGGCFAETTPTEAILKAWRDASEPGHITFKDASGHDVSLSVSFRGFAQAYDALPKP